MLQKQIQVEGGWQLGNTLRTFTFDPVLLPSDCVFGCVSISIQLCFPVSV